MAGIPGAARGYITGAALCASVCAAPSFLPGAGTPWGALALLAALYALGELCGRPARGVGVPVGSGSFFPVLLAAALLLPPSAAALAALPGALVGDVEGRAAPWWRRGWRSAQLGLAVWAAGCAAGRLGGADAVDGPHGVPDFPYVLVPTGAAVLVFCLVLTLLDCGILATAERVPVRAAWRGLLGRSLASHAVHGLVGLTMAVLWRSPYGWPSALFALLPMFLTGWVFAQYHRERAAHQATIRALVQAVDLKDTYTRGHSERVGRASVLIGRELGMDEARLETLRFAGTLHDVGKLGVPTRILRKDGPLTAEERRIIELHPEYGHEMVRGIGFLGEARSAILHHHERLDGTGYPYGLRGSEIPELARVVAVADAFDAMTSTRSYRRARPVDAALEELARCAGAQFDPAMVRALTLALAGHGWQTAVTSDERYVPQPRPVPKLGASPPDPRCRGFASRPQSPDGLVSAPGGTPCSKSSGELEERGFGGSAPDSGRGGVGERP